MQSIVLQKRDIVKRLRLEENRHSQKVNLIIKVLFQREK